MPEVHAKLSASGSSRWLNCPGSVMLEEGFPDTSSPYAQEGTLAHAIGEIKLKKYFTKEFGADKYKKELEQLKAQELFTKEMDSYTDEYFYYVRELALSFEDLPYVSVEERVDFSKWVPDGFGTCDCILIFGTQMHIIDLKYGKGVPVSPVSNSQLMLYALGAYNSYGDIYSIETITMHIVQPRVDNTDSFSMVLSDLLAWGEGVKVIAKKAYNGCEEFSLGEHCRFCKAKSRCPERAKEMFKSVEKLKPIMNSDIKLISNEDISRYLKESIGLIDWINDLEEEALASILKGEEIPGYKAVEGRSIRKFKDTDKAISLLEGAGYDEAVLYERKPLSLSKLEKLVGKKEFDNVLGTEVIKPQGKPTLVPESDKRDPYVKDLGFENLENI